MQSVLFLCTLVVCILVCTSSTWASSLGYCRKTSSSFSNANSFETSAFDPVSSSLFFGTKSNNPPLVLKLSSTSFSSSSSTSSSSFSSSISGEEALFTTVNDPTNGLVYFAGGSDPTTGSISRVFASNWTELDSLAIGDTVLSGVIDTTNGYVYFGTYGGFILKLNISNFNFTIEAQLDLSSNYILINCGVIDTSGGFAYFGSYLGSVLKIDLSTFTLASTLDISSADPTNYISTAAIDVANKLAYFGASKSTTTLFKVDLSALYMNLVDTLIVSGAQGPITSLIFDPSTNLGYVGSSPSALSGFVSRINFTSFTETGSILLDTGEEFLATAVADTTGGSAFFASSTDPGIIVQMQLTDPEKCQHSNCSSCLSGCSCGWCASTQTCLSGDSRGPFGDSCVAWDYYDCPCSNLTTCGECSTDSRCGWCAETQTCSRGDSTQPYAGTCSQWSYGSCIACNQTSCGACTADNRCGWCATTQTCSQGNATEPYAGTCPDWDYGGCPCDLPSSCGSCTSDSRCGWCGESQSCFRGNATLPFGETCGAWDYSTCPCSNLTSCSTCTTNSRCGWCAESQTCFEGNSTKPFGGTCQSWDFSSCPCASASNCTTCNADSRCGWCAETQTCSQGNSTAPYAGTCQAWDFGTCPCATATNCSSCNSNSLCGWCESSSTCMRGNSSYPLAGVCPDYKFATCPLPPQSNCSLYNASCSACTLFSECGWCDSTHQCVAGNATGASNGTCSSWNYASCPPPSNCSLYSSCSTCETNPQCGWCESSHACLSGNSTATSNGTCSDWHYSSCPVPSNCTVFHSCSSCETQPQCGWCESSNTCTTGNATGSSNGTCGNWFYTSCPPPPSNCSLYSNCSYCSTQPQCGWCGATQLCTAGNSAGSSNGTCSSNWQYSSCTPQLPNCAQYSSNCSTCNLYSACGWCDSTQQCVPGSSSGDTNGTCTNWLYASCPLPAQSNCSLYSTCSSCSVFSECGWCDSTQQCEAGNSTGSGNGTCSTWHYTSCPVNCSASADCNSCQTHTECGWCDTTHQCESGASSGATMGSCPSWYYASCPPSNNCTSYTTCGGCTSNSACGWCDSSSLCAAGSSSGPTAGSCSSWKFSNCTTPTLTPTPTPTPVNCTAHTDCSTCAAYAGCGWCASSSTCAAGNSSSISSGTCSDWRYATCSDPKFPLAFCGNFTSLASCVRASSVGIECGWCALGNGTCLPGNATMPTNGTCGTGGSSGGSDGWHFGASECDFNNCSSCITNSNCGWCDTTSKCVPGTASSAIQYSCPAWHFSDCPTWNCGQFTNCSQCTTYSNCSWCQGSSSSTCVSSASCAPSNQITSCGGATTGPSVKVAKHSLSSGAIAGIVVGVILGLALILIIAFIIYMKCRKPLKTKYDKYFAKGDDKKSFKGDGKFDEIALDEVVPNTASMTVSASPNLASGFSTPGNVTPPPYSQASASTKYIIDGPGSAGDITPTTPSPPQTREIPRPRREASALKTPKVRKPPRVEESTSEPASPPPTKKPSTPTSPKVKHISLPKSSPVAEDPTNKYAQLERLLQLPPLEVAAALLEVTNPANSAPDAETVPDQASFDAAVQNLVTVFANDVHKMALVLEWALTKDIHSAESTDLLFGEQCASAALTRVYFPIIGGSHLASGLGSMVLDICNHPEVYKDRIPATTHRILDTIQISINQSSLPEPLYHLLQIIESLVGMKFSLPAEQLPSTSTTFLLRHYYIAALLRPRNFGFVAANPSPDARQVLNQILDQIDKLWYESGENLEDAIHRASAAAQDSNTNSPALFANCEVPRVDAAAVLPSQQTREAAYANIHRLLDLYIDDLSNFMGIPLRLFQQDVLPKEGEEPFDVLCAVVSEKNPDPLPLLQQILSPDLACLLALFEQMSSKPDECDELALAAIHVFESYGQTHRLLLAQITNEAKTTLITSNIFKPPTSVGLRLCSYYMKISGSQYLLPTFKSLVDNLDASKETSYEVDKQKIQSVDQLVINKDNMLKLAGECLHLILDSVSNVPYIDRKIYRHMHLIIVKYASAEKAHDALVRLFVDGLIVPALSDPKGYGLMDDDPKPRVHKALSNVAKIFQSAAYGTPFPSNHVFAFANNFIQKNSQTLQDFVDGLAQQAKRPATVPPPVPISEELHRVSVACLHHYLTTYINNADYCYCYMKHCYFHKDESKTDKSYEKDLRELFFRSPTFYELVLVLNNLGTPPLDKHTSIRGQKKR